MELLSKKDIARRVGVEPDQLHNLPTPDLKGDDTSEGYRWTRAAVDAYLASLGEHPPRPEAAHILRNRPQYTLLDGFHVHLEWQADRPDLSDPERRLAPVGTCLHIDGDGVTVTTERPWEPYGRIEATWRGHPAAIAGVADNMLGHALTILLATSRARKAHYNAIDGVLTAPLEDIKRKQDRLTAAYRAGDARGYLLARNDLADAVAAALHAFVAAAVLDDSEETIDYATMKIADAALWDDHDVRQVAARRGIHLPPRRQDPTTSR